MSQRFLSRPRFIATCFFTLILFLLLSQFSLFDYHSLLAPRPSEVAVRCTTISIHNESDIKEAELIYGRAVHLMVHVYTISITREVQCKWLYREEDAPVFTLLYRDDYLNVSQIDITQLTRALEETNPLKVPFEAWYYGEYRGNWPGLDRHGLALEAVDPYRDGYVLAYLTMKFTLLAFSLTISVTCLWLVFLMRWRR